MHLVRQAFAPLALATAAILFAGCQSSENGGTGKTPAPVAPAPAAAPMAAAAAATPAAPGAPKAVLPPVRIKAGLATSLTDAEGHVWLPDQGFADGDTTEHSDDPKPSNTKSPEVYQTEHYSMSSFSYPVPNGKYVVKLHFAEMYEGIQGPGQRVFSFNVGGHVFKDFDVWVKAGGPRRAYIETVNVEVTNGKLEITFQSNIENPQINGIEILPAS